MGKVTHKLCSECKHWKTLRKFKKDRRYMAGVFCWCKTCEKSYASSPDVRKRNKFRWAQAMKDPKFREKERKRSKAKYHENPRKQKSRDYERKYGVSLNKFERATRCVLCSEKRKLVPDHNHETGRYRGPLCYRCNLAISQAEKYRSWLKRVRKYLRRR